MGDKLFDQIFNLKFTAKQMNRESLRCEKEERAEKLKLKKAIEKGNLDGARIFAQNAIRKKTEAMNYLRLSSRVDAVASRLQTAMKMTTVNKGMKDVVNILEKSLKSMNLEQISKTMDQFEKQFEDLDVQSDYVESAISQSTSMATPEDQVNELISQVADEYNLHLGEKLPQASAASAAASVSQEDKDLTDRLAKLKSAKT